MANLLQIRTEDVQNPIARAEFKHQRWVIENSRSGGIWIALAIALILPALLLSIGYTALIFIHPLVPDWLYWLNERIGELAFVIVTVATFSLYPVVTLITVGLSANSIRRERTGKTWDALRLTDVSARTIVRGKWWASLRAVNGDHLMAALMRIGWCAVLLAENVAPVDNTVPLIQRIPHPDASYLMLAIIALALIFGFLDAGISAAFGILTTAPERLAGAITSPIVLGIRGLSALGAGVVMIGFMIAGVYREIGWLIAIAIIGLIFYLVFLWLALRISERVVD